MKLSSCHLMNGRVVPRFCFALAAELHVMWERPSNALVANGAHHHPRVQFMNGCSSEQAYRIRIVRNRDCRSGVQIEHGGIRDEPRPMRSGTRLSHRRRISLASLCRLHFRFTCALSASSCCLPRLTIFRPVALPPDPLSIASHATDRRAVLSLSLGQSVVRGLIKHDDKRLAQRPMVT
jgi:hypothetical protein